MNRSGFIIAVTAAFFAGCGIGAVSSAVFTHVMQRVASSVVARAPHGGAFRHGRGVRSGAGPEDLLPHLSRMLRLDARQREQVEGILLHARAQHDVARDSMHASMERLLTPEQRIRWREIESRFPRGRRERDMPPPGGDRP